MSDLYETRGQIRRNGRNADVILTTGTSSVKSEEPKSVPRSDEAKVAKAFIKGLNTLSFDSRAVAVAFSMAPVVIQTRLMEVFRFWVDILEAKYNRGAMRGDEELELCTMAWRINDGMTPYEE